MQQSRDTRRDDDGTHSFPQHRGAPLAALTASALPGTQAVDNRCLLSSHRVGHVCVGTPGNRVGNPHAAAVDLWAAVRGKAHWLVRCLSRARVSARLWSTTEACATPTLRRRCKKSHPCIVDLFYRLFGTKIVMYGADPKAEPVYFIANHQHYHVSCLPGWLVRTRTSRRRRLRSHGCLFSSACAGQRDADLSHVRARSRRRRRWPPVDGQARPHGPAAGLVDVLQR